MAMMDYGAIAFKNGKLISTGMFTPMQDMVGWEDTKDDTYDLDHNNNAPEEAYVRPINLKDNYFAYIGDAEYTICFYKCMLVCVMRRDSDPHKFFLESEFLNWTHFKWTKWVDYFGDSDIVVTKRNGYYVCKWKYKGDKYKVYFGYGVDFDCYKKYHIVNYYRSPMYRISKIKYEIKRFWKGI